MRTRILLSFTMLVIPAFFILAFNKRAVAQPGTKGFAVLELFTSEGCSSCPAADAVLASLKKENRPGVFILGFHVDYWNRLGWKDRYSNADYSKRQEQYATLIPGSSVYTPQVIINGTHQLVGSNKKNIYKLIDASLHSTANTTLIIKATHSAGSITVTYSVKTKNEQLDNNVLNIALVQNEASTDVKNGENAGRKLYHVNIVRAFKTIALTKTSGSTTIQIPTQLTTGECFITAYTQNRNSGHITSAVSSLIN